MPDKDVQIWKDLFKAWAFTAHGHDACVWSETKHTIWAGPIKLTVRESQLAMSRGYGQALESPKPIAYEPSFDPQKFFDDLYKLASDDEDIIMGLPEYDEESYT